MDRPNRNNDSVREQIAAFPSPANVTPATLALHNNFVAAVTALKHDLLRSVHYLRVIQDRRVHRALGYADITAYAKAAVGFSPEQTRAFLALGRQLDRYPETKQALAEGRLSWSKARLIVTKADPEEERTWLDAARGLATGRLRRALADAAQRPDKADCGLAEPGEEARLEAASTAPTGPETTDDTDLQRVVPQYRPARNPGDIDSAIEPGNELSAVKTSGQAPAQRKLVVSYSLTPEQYARWEALTAVKGQGPKEERLLTGLEAANEAGNGGAGASRSGYGYLLMISRCPQCQAAELVTSRGRFPVEQALLQAAGCDGVLQAEDGSRRATIPPRLRRRVLARDGHRCQATQCTHTRHLQVHHRLPVAEGGRTTLDNLVALCAACHRTMHRQENELRAAGRDPIGDI